MTSTDYVRSLVWQPRSPAQTVLVTGGSKGARIWIADGPERAQALASQQSRSCSRISRIGGSTSLRSVGAKALRCSRWRRHSTTQRTLSSVRAVRRVVAERSGHGDVTKDEDNQRAVEDCIRSFGRLDALVLNAGSLDPLVRLADASIDDVRAHFDANTISLFSILKHALPYLRKAERGRVIFTGSGAATTAYSGWGPCAPKPARRFLTVQTRPQKQRQTRSVGHSPPRSLRSSQSACRQGRSTRACVTLS